MSRTYTTYWNPLDACARPEWTVVDGTGGQVENITLSVDGASGRYTRLTRFLPGADTTALGPQSHDYAEEILVLSGELYDRAFRRRLVAGDYASRPPNEAHGPFVTDVGCVVLEIAHREATPAVSGRGRGRRAP